MRNRKEKFSIYSNEELDAFAHYRNWEDENAQDEYLEKVAGQIGWIIIEFNRLEWQLHELIKKYLCNDIPETNAIYYEAISEKGFSSKVDILKKFFKVFYLGSKKHMFDQSEELSDFDTILNEVIKKLKDSAGLRNKYAHCYWHQIKEDNFVEFEYKVNTKDGLNKIFVRFNPNDLMADYHLIDDAQESLYNFELAFDEIYSNT